jgi:predicted PurR-regulated permease PerM
MINFMEKKIKIPRKIGTVFSLLFVFSLLGTILGLIISRLVKEIVNVYNQINEIFGSLQYFFDAVIERVNNIYISLPKTISDTIDEYFANAASNVQQWLSPWFQRSPGLP